MSLAAHEQDTQAKLKIALQDDPDSGKLERLAAALIGNMLGVTVAVAKSGFQHGGDAGSSGRQGRRLRIETKKYSDSTSLSDRELLGEIDHALARDQALEAWILVATREVKEQLEQDLNQKAESVGVPVLVLDFKSSGPSSLAALCTHSPDLVEQLFSRQAGDLARALAPALTDGVEQLKRELEAWQLGYEAVRRRSQDAVSGLWNVPRTSVACLGQNAAGGSVPEKVRRYAVHEQLTKWWDGPAATDAPAVLVGWDGVGKTWAAIDWLIDAADRLPIVLAIPSSAVAGTALSETGVKRLIADRLYALAGVRDRDHWLLRLDRLLRRPTSEGPVLTLLFDGLNQEASFSWLSLLKVLQASPFAGRVRVIASTRLHHYETKLSKLAGLVVSAVIIPVGPYSPEELDRMLAFHGLDRAALHRDLLELARTPRLFRLVVRLHEQVADAGRVTIHRLLWEYGRDSFGERAGRSFSEPEWREWLREIADRYRSGVRQFSLRSLGETAIRPDLSPEDIDARLSDIIDGRFAVPGVLGEFQLSQVIVAHSLGMALLNLLESTLPNSFEGLQNALNQWLDPIADFDQRAEILRAAVSLAIARATTSPAIGVLVTAWLQSQNIPDAHRLELGALSPYIPDALLDAVEHSDRQTHASARSWALRALCLVDSAHEGVFEAIVRRLSRWCGIVSREMWYRRNSEDSGKRQSERLIARIGVDRPGAVTVLGVELNLVDDDDEGLASLAATLLGRFPLERARPVFEVSAVANAVNRRSRSWDGLEWRVLLNERDPDPTRAMLRELSSDIRERRPELGVHPELANRAAALALWMSGTENDAAAAAALNPDLDRAPSYERDYLPNPAHSLFPLERRHAAEMLEDTSLRLHVHIQKAKDLWLDPTFEPPQSFVAELRRAIADVDVGALDGHASRTAEDHGLEESEPALARCAPDLLADLARRRIQNYPNRKQEERFWLTLGATSHFLIASEEEREAARSLRRRGTESKPSHELYAASQLLILEMKGQSAFDQAAGIIEAGVDALLLDMAETLAPLTPNDVSRLIDRFGSGTPDQRKVLLFVLANRPADLSDEAWSWVSEMASDPDAGLRGAAFRSLTLSNPSRFGGELYARDWAWSSKTHHWEADYGSIALIQGVPEVPFEQVAPRIAPWRLLEAARRRGEPSDVRLACAILSGVLGATGLQEPDPGALLSVDRVRDHDGLFRYSVTPIETEPESADSAEGLRRAFDREGQDRATTLHQSLRRKAAKYRHVEACAHHWWNTYLHSPDEVVANAAWTLFVRSADRRAWIWIDEPVDTSPIEGSTLRDVHFRLNRSKLERAMEKREDKLDRQFLGEDVVDGAGPWTLVI